MIPESFIELAIQDQLRSEKLYYDVSIEKNRKKASQLPKESEYIKARTPPLHLKYLKDFSGKFVIRIPPELHQKLYVEAIESGESLNKLIERKLKKAI